MTFETLREWPVGSTNRRDLSVVLERYPSGELGVAIRTVRLDGRTYATPIPLGLVDELLDALEDAADAAEGVG